MWIAFLSSESKDPDITKLEIINACFSLPKDRHLPNWIVTEKPGLYIWNGIQATFISRKN